MTYLKEIKDKEKEKEIINNMEKQQQLLKKVQINKQKNYLLYESKRNDIIISEKKKMNYILENIHNYDNNKTSMRYKIFNFLGLHLLKYLKILVETFQNLERILEFFKMNLFSKKLSIKKNKCLIEK